MSSPSPRATGFVREFGATDSTMIVAGSMIGAGIFIVSADIFRLVGSAGGQSIYLREAFSSIWGFLYGWATASLIALVLVLYRTQTSGIGLAVVLAGIPFYFIWRRSAATAPSS